MNVKYNDRKMVLKQLSRELQEHRESHSLGVELQRETELFVDSLMGILFPHFCKSQYRTADEIEWQLLLLEHDLKILLSSLSGDSRFDSQNVAGEFMSLLPEVYHKLCLDAEAINKGDPAAESVDEVILAYPGFRAIAIYRLAHEFYKLHVPIFPRLLTEYAHGKTGIDIHPGAQIGTSFAIDHGSGIVIGESAIIGDNVKMYQGVTLGALSVDKKIAKSKRHPTIEHDVVIYAQAVILGGKTTVGHHSIIGGNVWLTHSVPEYSVVSQEQKAIVQSKEGLEGVLNYVI